MPVCVQQDTVGLCRATDSRLQVLEGNGQRWHVSRPEGGRGSRVVPPPCCSAGGGGLCRGAPQAPPPPRAISGSHGVLLFVGDQERNAFTAKALLLLAGGPRAPALRGLDWRHRKNVLQESSQHGKDGEGF